MNHLDQAGFNIAAAMTCVLPMAHTVYIGDEDGRVVSYLFALIVIFEMLICPEVRVGLHSTAWRTLTRRIYVCGMARGKIRSCPC